MVGHNRQHGGRKGWHHIFCFVATYLSDAIAGVSLTLAVSWCARSTVSAASTAATAAAASGATPVGL